MFQDLQSLGHAAAVYQQDPRLIELAISAVQVKNSAEPALALNGLRYFRTDDVVAAIGWIAEHAARRAAEAAAKAAEGRGDA